MIHRIGWQDSAINGILSVFLAIAHKAGRFSLSKEPSQRRIVSELNDAFGANVYTINLSAADVVCERSFLWPL